MSKHIAIAVQGGSSAQQDQVLSILRASDLFHMSCEAQVVIQIGTVAEMLQRCGGAHTVTIALVSGELSSTEHQELFNRGFFDVLHAAEWTEPRLARVVLRAGAFGRTAVHGERLPVPGGHSHFLETIVDAAPMGIAFWDRDLRYRRVNAAMAAINGLAVEAHYGRTPSEVLPELSGQIESLVHHVLATGETLCQEQTGATPAQAGRQRTWLVNYFPVRSDTELDGVAAIWEEVSERKTIEKERERFIAVLGHDLRNPLSAILMSTQVLRNRVDDREKGIVDRIKRSGFRMQRMIRDLLDFARLRQGGGLHVRPTNGDLVEVLRDVVLELKQGHPDSRVSVSAPASLGGMWDLERLAQVLSNLVGNALQHGLPGSEVRVEAHETGGDWVEVTIFNAGEPIAREQLESFFEPFRQGTQEGTRDSLGLGLFIARALVTAHGGSVNLRPIEGGTEALVRLPRHTPSGG
ncbi:MAG: PAS domain-containing sensor histidine kinase [Myxococcales bacterium]|nr:PAS domain-containing sensor histidine kinase [Myxococcales bacterium]